MTVFIQQGDAPLEVRQAVKRGLQHFNAQLPQWQREQGIVTDDPAYQAWAAQWVADNEVNTANNLFNHQLAAYRKYQARLAQYVLSEGRPEVTEVMDTGEVDEEGQPILATVVTQTAIDPLPAEIEQAIIDPETGEQTGTEMVPNPAIAQDVTERATAQAIIDSLPQEVKDFAA
jgi:hypothetical protein